MSQKAKARTKITGEVFTPTKLVEEMLDKLPIDVFTDPTKTFIDPACGNGQFIVPVIDKKIANGSTLQEALSTTYGVDLMIDNVCDTICRLYLLVNGYKNTFDESGHDSELKISHSYHDIDDHPAFDWLYQHQDFYRLYRYDGHEIRIEFAEYTKSEQGAYFKCNGVVWHTIVCADSLSFLKITPNEFTQQLYDIEKILMNKKIEPISATEEDKTKARIEAIVEKAVSSLFDEIDVLQLNNKHLTEQLTQKNNIIDQIKALIS